MAAASRQHIGVDRRHRWVRCNSKLTSASAWTSAIQASPSKGWPPVLWRTLVQTQAPSEGNSSVPALIIAHKEASLEDRLLVELRFSPSIVEPLVSYTGTAPQRTVMRSICFIPECGVSLDRQRWPKLVLSLGDLIAEKISVYLGSLFIRQSGPHPRS